MEQEEYERWMEELSERHYFEFCMYMFDEVCPKCRKNKSRPIDRLCDFCEEPEN